MSEVKPYSREEGKKKQVEHMFDNIAGTYDLLNHLFTFNIDKGWRKKMIRMLAPAHPKQILDVATGTGDVAIMMAKMLKPEMVTGIDLSRKMLDIGQKKIEDQNLTHIIKLDQGDSENLAFPNESFDAVTVAFGVRNFEDLEKGLREMNRVTKPGGQLAILEFSKPEPGFFSALYKFYSRHVMPIVGKITSGDKDAYSYLFESVQHFPHGQSFIDILQKTGFKETTATPLFGGVCTIYKSIK